MTLTNSTVSGNTINSSSSVNAGGGILNDRGTVTLTDSTISDNTITGTAGLASNSGGGIYSERGTVTLTGSTISGNAINGNSGSAQGGGGGGFGGGGGGQRLTGLGGFGGGAGGGLNPSPGETYVVGSTTTPAVGAQVNTATVTLTNANLVRTQAALSATSLPSPTLTADPKLGTLAVLNNCVAGTCKPAVLPLLAGSPAINAATGTSPATDETGTPRPQGSLADLGAYELCCPPISVLDVTGGGSFCVGGTGVAVGLSGSQMGVNYRLVLNGFTNVGAAVPGTGMVLPFGNQTAAGTYSVVAIGTVVAGCPPTTMNGNAVVTINTPPLVTTNPLPQIVGQGATASFTAAASGSPAPTVQWQVDSGAGFTNIPGATNTTLNVPNVTLAMNGHRYRAVFTNTCGSVTSRCQHAQSPTRRSAALPECRWLSRRDRHDHQ